MADLPPIYRVPLRSLKPEAMSRWAEQVEHCRSNGIVGIGWGLGHEPESLEACLDWIRDASWDGWGSTAANTVKRFANAPDGALVWSRDVDGTYLVGKLNGPWRHDNSAQATLVDTHQVRPAQWAPRQLLDVEVPGAVVRSFSTIGTSFQQIHNDAARLYSHRLYAELTGQPTDLPAPTADDVIKHLLDPFDVEDLVFTYLQARGYLVLPASRRTDTAAYEYVMVHRDTGKLAVTQVKTGDSSVDLDLLASTAGVRYDAFAYSTGGHYHGNDDGRIERLTDDQLLKFATDTPRLLPPRVRRWLDYASC